MAESHESAPKKWSARELSDKLAELLDTLGKFTENAESLSQLADPNANAPYAMALFTVVSLRDHFVKVYHNHEGSDLPGVDAVVNRAISQVERLIREVENSVTAATSAVTKS